MIAARPFSDATIRYNFSVIQIKLNVPTYSSISNLFICVIAYGLEYPLLQKLLSNVWSILSRFVKITRRVSIIVIVGKNVDGFTE